MVVINVCQCVFPGVQVAAPKEVELNAEEKVALLQEEGSVLKAHEAEVMVEHVQAAKKLVSEKPPADLMKYCNRGLDIFKGILVIFMTWAHVDLTLMAPQMQYYSKVPHFVGNFASGCCFLGFMMAYGFSCDNAYISDFKKRSFYQRMERLMRSAMLPVMGAWVCGLGWGYMCWKLPLTMQGLLMVLDFRLALGNGPDFLLCFTACILTMYPLRHYVNAGLASPDLAKRAATVVTMLGLPLAMTFFVIPDCTGMNKYFGYFFECAKREAYSPVLPGIPHLFYFNIGLLMSRWIKNFQAQVKAGEAPEAKRMCFFGLGIAAVFLFMSYPLFSVWDNNYGNLMRPTKWGMVTRGFTNGPSILWLVGNLFWVYCLLLSCIATHVAVLNAPKLVAVPARMLLDELEHLGANVLLYLVLGDLLLAGLWRGMMNQYPLDVNGCWTMTIILFFVIRFVHYLGASSRSTGGMPSAG